jgi:hypothetical protein
MTSDASWSASLRQIGDLERQDHWFLRPGDQCYFFGEYTARAGFGASRTNNIISNLKKKPSTRGTQQWQYKLGAIRAVGAAIRGNIRPEALPQMLFVPIPPSKPTGHPEHDDRVAQIARAVGGCEVREILFTAQERDARHLAADRRDPDALRATLGVREDLLTGLGDRPIVLLDDVLTTGCSYTVCRDVLAGLAPEANVFGIFVARRVIDRSAEAMGFTDLTLD